ncbi:MAG: hypothetical protein WC333_02200 [Dehalococcoidia bacterium]|jgi:hypothetical protein
MSVVDECLIEHDFKLPSHANELSKAEDLIEKLRIRILKIKSAGCINGRIHGNLYEEIVRVLDYVGGLSRAAFAVQEEVEAVYFRKYKSTPALAKKLWLDHYALIHKPYNRLKNRCFRMLEELDEEHIRRVGKNPPNWNI